MTVPSPESYRKAVKIVQAYHANVKVNHPRELAIRIAETLKLSTADAKTMEAILRNEVPVVVKVPEQPISPVPQWSTSFPQ